MSTTYKIVEGTIGLVVILGIIGWGFFRMLKRSYDPAQVLFKLAITVPLGPLKPIDPQKRQHALQDRRQADQHHQQFEQACQAGFVDKLVNGPKTDRADDANNQNPDQD
ncbi:MAG: hypothetical protein ACLP8B_01110 [Xanthobacteraceae bacterium]